MESKQELFDKYMEEYVKLNTLQKKYELVEKHKNILANLLEYANLNDIEYDFVKSREIKDIMTDAATVDDYFEALMAYTHNIEELIGTILLNLQ